MNNTDNKLSKDSLIIVNKILYDDYKHKLDSLTIELWSGWGGN